MVKDANQPAVARKSYKIEAVGRALNVLEELAEKPGLGVTALANEMGLTKSIVFRLLQTLEESGYVHRDPERATFTLGYRVALLGERVGRDGALLHVAPPIMDELRDQTGENVNLVIREGSYALALATREGLHAIRIFAQKGRKGPLHAGGASMLLLAYAEPAILERVLGSELKSYTNHTITDPEQLSKVLHRIRANGYNVALNDLDDGAFSIAAPIFNASGEVVAGLSIAGATVRLDEPQREAYIEAVQEAAQKISAKLTLG
ncbi:IclR family transcriptional regulator [Sulfitobacter guttiformis]|uniref:IclR family transcriptional regulator n=1 Tax=Sulfitobacter guttiformis TaxID=74349 RepID=A0A420DRJ3_9RHOB|nr:IclR family transcriptional regulator [Sulfitobacter guttiformis]RKE96951.1 IclR family transcriptional regulator [Sulfitobacter guttiformis]